MTAPTITSLDVTSARDANGPVQLQPTAIGVNPAVAPSGGQQSLFLVFETVDAGTSIVDTGYKPPAGHAAGLDGKITAMVETGASQDLASARNTAGTVHQVTAGGNCVVDGYNGGVAVGNAAVNGFTVAASVSGAGTLEFTVTAPGGFVGKIRYLYALNITEN